MQCCSSGEDYCEYCCYADAMCDVRRGTCRQKLFTECLNSKNENQVQDGTRRWIYENGTVALVGPEATMLSAQS